MNAKTAKLIRAAANYKHAAEYDEVQLHRVLQMQDYEKHTRTIREMGPVSPGAATNLRWQGHAVHGQWVPRAGARACVISRTIEKIRYLPDGKTPAQALVRMNADTKQFEPVYILIPCTKPVHLKPGSPKRVYREMKRLEARVGLDALYKKLESESFDGLVGT